MKRVLIVAIVLIAAFVALYAFMPLVAYSLAAFVVAPVLSGVAFVANLIVPMDEKSFRVEARVTVDGTDYRATGISTCRTLYETYGDAGLRIGRRLKIFGGHVALTLPDRRRVESSAFLVCSADGFAEVKDKVAFYLVDRRGLPIRAQYTSVARSEANPAAPFRVAIVSAGPTNEAQWGPSHLPDHLFAVPHAIDDVRNSLASYVALPIPKDIWSADEKLRTAYSAITELRAVAKPPNDVLKRMVEQTSAWPVSGALTPDHSRVDLPAFGSPRPIEYVAIQARPPPGHSGVPYKYPVPQVCLGERCVTMPMTTPTSEEKIFGREAYLFDPVSQNLIALYVTFAGIYDPGKATFIP